MDIAAALTLGFLGSMHCIGMCGPLMLAMPTSSVSRSHYLIERILYHLGRSITYGLMGLGAGFIGNNIFTSAQQDLSLLLGISILLSLAIPIGLKTRFGRYSPLKRIHAFIKIKFSILMGKRGRTALMLMGLLNGLLPCGLVYTALVGATVVADPLSSGLFMIIFGIGTAPALITLSMTRTLIGRKFQPFLRGSLPTLGAVIAVLLILRGMNLGIPLISPKINHVNDRGAVMECCEENR